MAALLVGAQVLLVAVALAVPSTFAWLRQEARALGLQHDVRAAGSPQPVVPVGGGPTLLVLCYHDISPTPRSPYTVTPHAFAAQMRLIRAAGYTSASGADVLAALAGRPVPGHRVLVTFDDGAKGIWSYADRILRREQLHGMAFIITGRVGTHQPYYVTWPELAAMQRSGRWDIESHTHLAHGLVPVSASGAQAPALANLTWLPDEGRLETVDEYARRVTADLALSKSTLAEHGLPVPRFFAYPFSAVAHPSNDQHVADRLRLVVGEQFAAAFYNAAGAGPVTQVELGDHIVRRFEITGSTTLADLEAELRRTSPTSVAGADLGSASSWCCAATGPNVSTGPGGSLRITTGAATGWRTSTYVPSSAAGWGAYTFSAVVAGLSVSGPSGAMLVRSDGLAGIRVAVGRATLRAEAVDVDGRAHVIARRELSAAARHTLVITVGPGGEHVSVDGGSAVVDIPDGTGPATGAIGLATSRTAPSQDPWFDHVQLVRPT